MRIRPCYWAAKTRLEQMKKNVKQIQHYQKSMCDWSLPTALCFCPLFYSTAQAAGPTVMRKQRTLGSLAALNQPPRHFITISLVPHLLEHQYWAHQQSLCSTVLLLSTLD